MMWTVNRKDVDIASGTNTSEKYDMAIHDVDDMDMGKLLQELVFHDDAYSSSITGAMREECLDRMVDV